MKTVSEHIRTHLFHAPESIPDLCILRITEWSDEFEQMQRNRLIMGQFRYGPFKSKNRSTKKVIEDIKRRADLYLEERNTEYLVDIANLAMKIFVGDEHHKKHFRAADDEIHTK